MHSHDSSCSAIKTAWIGLQGRAILDFKTWFPLCLHIQIKYFPKGLTAKFYQHTENKEIKSESAHTPRSIMHKKAEPWDRDDDINGRHSKKVRPCATLKPRKYRGVPGLILSVQGNVIYEVLMHHTEYQRSGRTRSVETRRRRHPENDRWGLGAGGTSSVCDVCMFL